MTVIISLYGFDLPLLFPFISSCESTEPANDLISDWLIFSPLKALEAMLEVLSEDCLVGFFAIFKSPYTLVGLALIGCP